MNARRYRVPNRFSGFPLAGGCGAAPGQITLDHLRPSPEWKKQVDELQLAKECEAEIRKGIKALAKRRSKEEKWQRLIQKVADEFRFAGG